ncbi:hypothetical protein DSM26151_00100 [Agromyces marinus]|nr:hypothetical protein DSM26151_00100 [Agromyces marinus]
MTFYASTYEWPTQSIEFTAVGYGARDGAGEIVQHDVRFILKAPGCFSFATGQPETRTLRTSIDNRAALLRGGIFILAGQPGLRIDELRVGSDEEQPRYTEVLATFEHLDSICSYRCDDGAQRSMSAPLTLPALEDAGQMSATFPSAPGSVTIASPVPVPLDAFETHLDALQDLLTFAADMPVGRLSLSATDEGGRTVQIHGRDRYAPFARPLRQPIEHQLRLSGEWAQTVIDRWWAARESLRPIPQVAAALRYQPGYVEADVLFSAAAIEALATGTDVGEQPRLSDGDAQPIIAALDSLSGLNNDQRQIVAQLKADTRRTTFRSKVRLLLATVSDTAVGNSRVAVEEWLPRFIETRNSIAHGSNDTRPSRSIWTDSALLRAVRDANRVLLSLAFLAHLGVPDAALERAAERLGNRYGGRHRPTGIFV